MDVRHAAMRDATAVRRDAMTAAPTGIVATQRELANREAMVSDQVAAVTANRAKAARTTMRVKDAKASPVKDARKASVAMAARNSAKAGMRKRSNRVRRAKR